MEAKGGEVRRIHIVYFLCRMGKAEHPHLIRLGLQNRNGIRLRDVKRWLAEVRGKDMPDSFSWSYRRKYKTGYAWQDLLDDDLITPISDNEYVLKGSEISSYPDTSFISENSPLSEKTSFNSSNESIRLHRPEKLKPEKSTANAIPVTAGTTLLAYEVLDDEKSTETDSTVLTKSSTEARENIGDSSQSSSPSSVISLDETQEYENHSTKKEEAPPLRRSKLRDLLTCRTSDASDPVVVSTKRQQKGEVNKMERLRPEGPEPGTILSQSWSQSQPFRRKRCNNAKSLKKENDAIYKPVAKPNCSQCGKRFKPEKLHAHMQSCPGMKNRAKRSEATKTTQTETEDASITTGIAQL